MKTKQQITVEHRHTMILMMDVMRMFMLVMLVMMMLMMTMMMMTMMMMMLMMMMMMGQGPFQIIATASGEDAFETNGC